MNREEIILLARNAILQEDSHAIEECIFIIADEYLRTEDKCDLRWTERDE